MGAEGYRSVGQTVDNCSSLTITEGSADRAPITSNRIPGSPLYLSAPCRYCTARLSPAREQLGTKQNIKKSSVNHNDITDRVWTRSRMHCCCTATCCCFAFRTGTASRRWKHAAEQPGRHTAAGVGRRETAASAKTRCTQPAKASQAARRTSHADERPVGDAHLAERPYRH